MQKIIIENIKKNYENVRKIIMKEESFNLKFKKINESYKNIKIDD